MVHERKWWQKPRYSVLNVALFLLIAVGAGGVSTYWGIASTAKRFYLGTRAWQQSFLKETYTTPFPDIIIAVSATERDPNAYRREYDFTIDYFTRCIPLWEKVLASYSGKANVSYLEVGAFEGGSAIWMLENILTDPTARLTAIDIFAGPYKDRFRKNIDRSGFSSKVTTIAQASQIALRGLPLESFDIIYIDGSHLKGDVLEDAVLSWRLLKVGGLMIFDDYSYAVRLENPKGIPFGRPELAIDPFVKCFSNRCEVIHNEWQLIIRKNAP